MTARARIPLVDRRDRRAHERLEQRFNLLVQLRVLDQRCRDGGQGAEALFVFAVEGAAVELVEDL